MQKAHGHIAPVSKKQRPAKAMGGCDEHNDDFLEKKCTKGKIDEPNSAR